MPMIFPDIAPDEDGESVGFEWNDGADRKVWMDWEKDGSIRVYCRDGALVRERDFAPGQGYALHEFLSEAFKRFQ